MTKRKNTGSKSLLASLPASLRHAITRHSLQPLAQAVLPTEAVTALYPSGACETTAPSPVQQRAPDPQEYKDIREGDAGSTKRGVLGESSQQSIVKRVKRAHAGEVTCSRKGKGNATDHPWDCTGLVPRYTRNADVPASLQKYFAQRHLLFSQYSSTPILMDETGWYSVTPEPIAVQIAARCRGDTVLDAFCGVGGNAIQFAMECERVIAMDNDLTRLRLARHNALHCGVADRIEFILADFVDFAESYDKRHAAKSREDEIDVVFLSPPWGGPEYLSMGKKADGETEQSAYYPLSALLPIHGRKLFELASKITPNIAYFLPRNVDLQELAELAPVHEAEEGNGLEREFVEVEEEWVGYKLKAVTAYYGGLANLSA